MPYSTIPITSGAAKFSTLDPDADLFLEENNITVGANPENPATLYDYDTSTLHITNISGNNGDLNLIDSNLIGVNQFVCKDYLGAVKATASDNVQATLTLNDVIGLGVYSKNFRVPSNFLNNASVKVSFYVTNTGAEAKNAHICNGIDRSIVASVLIPANTTTPTEYTITLNNINPGELYCFMGHTYVTVLGSSGVKIKCDLAIVTGGYWAIID